MLSSTRTNTAASSSSRLTASLGQGSCTNASPALQDQGKGKGRATSPETPRPSCYYIGEDSLATLNTDERLCLLDTDTTPKTTSTDSASPLTPPFGLSDSASFPSSSWESNEEKSVSINLGDPFTFEPFTHQQHPHRSKAAVLGMRRRPYQSGTTSISPPTREEDRLSRMDRAAIFTGLQSSAAHSPPPSLQPLLHLNESISSSSKRSFEEATSPISSPPSANDGISGVSLLQEGTSRCFSSSLSHSIDALRSSYGGSSSTGTHLSQATRRRIPHKRRRAAASSPTMTEDSAVTEAMEVDGGSSRSTGGSATQAPRMWSSLQSSFEDNSDTNVDNVDLPSSTTQLLRQWWLDSEETPSAGSQYGSDHSTVAEMGSEQDVTELQASRSEVAHTSSSSMASASGSLPGSHTVLRRLRLQERVEEEDVRVQENSSSTANDSDYHDQLMDVFRRMNGRSGQEQAQSVPRPPLRSTIMMRSTTQSLSRNSSRVEEDTADDGSDVGDIIASYMEAEDALSQTGSPPTMLPSARAFASEQAQARLSQAALASRVSTLQAHHNAVSFQELARRNQEVLQRYSDPNTRVRPRHTGSPTIPPLEIDEVEERTNHSESTFLGALGIRNEERDAGESIFHYRPPSSRRPGHAGLSAISATQRDNEADALLWGEYLLSRGPPRSQVEEPMPLNATPAGTEQSSSDASLYLSRLSERLASSTSSLAAARRRVGALDSNGRLRGPTRRQNEHWLGLSSGEYVASQESSDVLSRRQRMLPDPPSLEEQERVMSTYRHMSFPDPESSVAAATQQQESTSLLNRPPQLPSLRSRSPFELPFVGSTEAAPSSSADQSRTDYSNGSESWPSVSSGRHIARPHLRPLTLSSRIGSSLSHRSPRREPSAASSTLSERRPLPTFRLSDPPLMTEAGTNRTTARTESSPHRTPTELRELFELTGRSDVMVDHLDNLSSRRRRRRNQYEAERGELPLLGESESPASVTHPRRLPLQTMSASRILRQRTTAGLHARRRPTLLEADSSAVDMELQSRDRFDLDSLMLSTREGALSRQEELGSTSSSRAAAPSTVPSSSRYVPRRPTSRWDRYMEEVGTSIGLRSIMEAQGQEQPFSSHSFFSSLSRLPGSSLASTLHSEIATNPANYVADDEFALRDTYEGLLQLSAQIGDVRCKSTPAQVIAKLPTCLYTDWHGGCCKKTNHIDASGMYDFSKSSPDKGKARAKDHECDSKDTSCSICLESYSALDTVMSLPCNHAFHESCLVTWLKTARSCPCCRGDVCANEPNSKISHSSSLRILPELYF